MIGTTVAHYRIDDKLGEGGMGVVYRATDTRLDRTVALKFLSPQLSSDREARARFTQEARAASALEDDNICTIYEIGTSDDGQMYIAMAFYEGEALNVRLGQSSPLAVPEALAIARQVAAGLQTAHGHGITHRDIKPGNVMVTNRGRVKILDFGLAKLGTSGDLTQAGSTLGTTSYMSPEQVRSEAAGPASDVWSLGVMVYEMLAGRKPFTGDYEQAILYAILNEEPAPVDTQRPEIPASVAVVVGRCLSKDADDRPSAKEVFDVLAAETPGWSPEVPSPTDSAMESGPWYHEAWKVAAVFGGFAAVAMALVYVAVMQFGLPDWVLLGAVVLLAVGLPVVLYAGQLERRRSASSRFRREQAGVLRIITWRNAWYGGLFAFGGLALVSGGYMVMRLMGIGPAATLVSSGVLQENDRVILAEFENRTADSTLAPSITEALRIDLSQSPVISLMDRSQIDAALQRMNAPTRNLTVETARTVAQREGVKAVVQGEVGQLGSGFVLIASVVSPSDGRTLVSLRETAGDEGEVIAAVDRLSASLREEIGESLKTIRATQPLERVTTGSLEALRKYTAAEAVAAGERMIELLEEAIELDSTFAMAYRKLSVALANSGGDFAEQIRAATRAYELRNRLPTLEKLQTEAYFHWAVDFDLEAATEAYRAILDVEPDDYIALNNLGIGLQRMGRVEEAAALYRRSVDQRPDGFASWSNLVPALVELGRVDEAWATIREYEGQAGRGALSAWLEMTVHSQSRRPDSVLSALEPHLAVEDDVVRWWIRYMHTASLWSVGRLQEARRGAHELAELSVQRELPVWKLLVRLDEALAQVMLLGSREQGVSTIDEALQTVPLDSLQVLNRPYLELATALAYAGEVPRAEAYLEQYERNVPEGLRRAEPERHRARGAVALADGRADDAVAHYKSLDAELPDAGLYELALAQRLAGDTDAAVNTLERLEGPGQWDAVDLERMTLAPSYRLLGELYEERGNVDAAIEAYTRFVELWKNADAGLQPQVEETRSRIDELLQRSAREPGS